MELTTLTAFQSRCYRCDKLFANPEDVVKIFVKTHQRNEYICRSCLAQKEEMKKKQQAALTALTQYAPDVSQIHKNTNAGQRGFGQATTSMPGVTRGPDGNPRQTSGTPARVAQRNQFLQPRQPQYQPLEGTYSDDHDRYGEANRRGMQMARSNRDGGFHSPSPGKRRPSTTPDRTRQPSAATVIFNTSADIVGAALQVTGQVSVNARCHPNDNEHTDSVLVKDGFHMPIDITSGMLTELLKARMKQQIPRLLAVRYGLPPDEVKLPLNFEHATFHGFRNIDLLSYDNVKRQYLEMVEVATNVKGNPNKVKQPPAAKVLFTILLGPVDSDNFQQLKLRLEKKGLSSATRSAPATYSMSMAEYSAADVGSSPTPQPKPKPKAKSTSLSKQPTTRPVTPDQSEPFPLSWTAGMPFTPKPTAQPATRLHDKAVGMTPNHPAKTNIASAGNNLTPKGPPNGKTADGKNLQDANPPAQTEGPLQGDYQADDRAPDANPPAQTEGPPQDAYQEEYINYEDPETKHAVIEHVFNLGNNVLVTTPFSQKPEVQQICLLEAKQVGITSLVKSTGPTPTAAVHVGSSIYGTLTVDKTKEHKGGMKVCTKGTLTLDASRAKDNLDNSFFPINQAVDVAVKKFIRPSTEESFMLLTEYGILLAATTLWDQFLKWLAANPFTATLGDEYREAREIRFVRGAIAQITNSEVIRLVEQWIDADHTRTLPACKHRFRKYISNSSATPLEEAVKSEPRVTAFLVMSQHAIFMLTDFHLVLSDYQGARNEGKPGIFLTDPQVLTAGNSPAGQPRGFGEGNVRSSIMKFPFEHRCNVLCLNYRLPLLTDHLDRMKGWLDETQVPATLKAEGEAWAAMWKSRHANIYAEHAAIATKTATKRKRTTLARDLGQLNVVDVDASQPRMTRTKAKATVTVGV